MQLFLQKRFWGLEKEKLEVFLLNEESRVVCIYKVQEYKDNHSVSLDFKTLMKVLSLAAPESILLVHNHPSGNVSPSKNDDVAFEEICALCKKQGIRVLDSIIVAEDRLHSYYHAQSFQINWRK